MKIFAHENILISIKFKTYKEKQPIMKTLKLPLLYIKRKKKKKKKIKK